MRRSVALIAALIACLSGAQSVQAQTAPDYAAISRENGIMRDRPGRGAAMARAHTYAFDSDREAYSPAVRQRAFRRAESLLAASRTSCDVVNAAQLGRTERRRDIVEVACASGHGYILVDGVTPAAFDCLQIARVAAAVRTEYPRADVGSQCTLNENGG